VVLHLRNLVLLLAPEERRTSWTKLIWERESRFRGGIEKSTKLDSARIILVPLEQADLAAGEVCVVGSRGRTVWRRRQG